VPKALDRRAVVASVRKALDRGRTEYVSFGKGRAAPHSWRSKLAGNCECPVIVDQLGRPLSKGRKSVHTVTMTSETPIFHEMEVPCRKCGSCLRRRAHHWRLRAMSETKVATRTWFGTLTLAPEQHANVAAACRLAASRNGDDFDAFTPERQFALRHACISREITLYLKRLRKEAAVEFRFLCVAEEHKSGLPHYHMLIHECDAGPVKYRTLTKQWRVGFSTWKLVNDPMAAGYVCKYLAKSSKARVRASLDYGSRPQVIGTIRNCSVLPSALSPSPSPSLPIGSFEPREAGETLARKGGPWGGTLLWVPSFIPETVGGELSSQERRNDDV